MSSSAFRNQYYRERLTFYERLDLAHYSETELTNVAGEASALHKFLTDIMEEGYTATVNQLVEQTDAMNRLQRFLTAVLHVLGPPSERERFYLFPKSTHQEQITTESFEGGETFELHAYLDQLDRLPDREVDIVH